MAIQVCSGLVRSGWGRGLMACAVLILSLMGDDARGAGDFQIVEDDLHIQIWTPIGRLRGERQKGAMKILVSLIESKLEEVHHSGKLPSVITRETLLAARNSQGVFDQAIEMLTGKDSYGMGILEKFALSPGNMSKGVSPIPRALMGFISFGKRFGAGKYLGVAMDFGVIVMGYHVTYIPKYKLSEDLRKSLLPSAKQLENGKDFVSLGLEEGREANATEEDVEKILEAVDGDEIQEGWRMRWTITGWLGPQVGKEIKPTNDSTGSPGVTLSLGAIWGAMVRPEEFHGVALSPAVAFPDLKLWGHHNLYLRVGALMDDSHKLVGRNRFALLGVEPGDGKKYDLRFDFKFILPESILVKYFKKVVTLIPDAETVRGMTGTLAIDPNGNPRYE